MYLPPLPIRQGLLVLGEDPHRAAGRTLSGFSTTGMLRMLPLIRDRWAISLPSLSGKYRTPYEDLHVLGITRRGIGRKGRDWIFGLTIPP